MVVHKKTGESRERRVDSVFSSYIKKMELF